MPVHFFWLLGCGRRFEFTGGWNKGLRVNRAQCVPYSDPVAEQAIELSVAARDGCGVAGDFLCKQALSRFQFRQCRSQCSFVGVFHASFSEISGCHRINRLPNARRDSLIHAGHIDAADTLNSMLDRLHSLNVIGARRSCGFYR